MNKPYIGVTDFVSREQVEQAKACIPVKCNRRLHVGVMTSYKVISGIPTSSGWEHIWLNAQQMQQLFVDDKEVYNVLHYADYDDHTTVDHLLAALDRAGPYVHGLQLDMVWPNPIMIAQVRYAVPGVSVILQVSSKAIEQPLDWAEKLKEYAGVIDYVLIDTGMGRGIAFDPIHTISRINQVMRSGFTQEQIAVAGGLGPSTYENLRPVLQAYPHISCDAQGRLRSSHSAKDPLEMDRVAKYVSGVCSLICN